MNMEANKQSTAVNPMMALTLAMIYWAEAVRSKTQSVHYPIDTVKRMAFLRKVGLTKTVNAEEIKDYASKVELLQFMRNMWKNLGENTLLVKFSDFYKILCDYDLVCGDFSLYIGEIPEKNMQKIEAVVEAYEGGVMEGYANPISYCKQIRVPRHGNNAVDAVRMPFDGLGKTRMSGYLCDVKANNSQFSKLPFFIAAPRPQMQPIKLTYEETFLYGSHSYEISFDENGATIQSLVKTKYNSEFVPVPFVCSLCDHGVIIHSMWGAEAEDATIKRYEQLRDAIIGNSKSLTV